MKTYRIRLIPASPWASPWHADSIFGALAWRCAEAFGEEVLLDWIRRFRDSDPPFLISDGLPGDWFPAPVGPAYQSRLGRAKPPVWVREYDFVRMLRDPDFRIQGAASAAPLYVPADRRHASLGRSSDRSDSGGALFEVEQHVLSEAAGRYIALYVRAHSASLPETLADLLSFVGFGRKSSTGLGAFRLGGGPEWCDWLDAYQGASGFLSLSHFVPARTDPSAGAWRTHVTYPKYHGTSVGHPFKGRLIQLTPGSWFATPGRPRPWYGRLVDQPCDEFPRAVQYGLALAVPMNLTAS